MQASPLLRPSQLARFWELHPKTVYLWIRDGRLPAVRTPGDQFRLRVEDVRAFCQANKMAVPPFVTPTVKQVLLIGVAGASKVLKLAVKPNHATLITHDTAIEGLLAAVTSPASLLLIDAASAPFVIEDAVRALRRASSTQRTPIVVFNLSTSARAEAVVRAGATHAIVREKFLAERLAEVLGS